MKNTLEVQLLPSKEREEVKIVKFVGDFDKAGHEEVRQSLKDIVSAFKDKFLVFDFSSLNFINSEGIGYLMEIDSYLLNKDKVLVLVGLKANISDIFETIGLEKIVKIYENLKEFYNKEF